MFTGIVQHKGRIESVAMRGEQARIRVTAPPDMTGALRKGDSVSVSGVCLTAVEIGSDWIEFDAVATTLKRTRLLDLTRGQRVNLEPALRLGDPLGGHLVSGHVDGVGTVRAVERKPGEWRLTVQCPAEVLPFLVERGSVALDGVSLTVASLGRDCLEVAVIPHTFEYTTLGEAKAGDPINLEADMIGRYVAKYLGAVQGKGEITWDKLAREGFVK